MVNFAKVLFVSDEIEYVQSISQERFQGLRTKWSRRIELHQRSNDFEKVDLGVNNKV